MVRHFDKVGFFLFFGMILNTHCWGETREECLEDLLLRHFFYRGESHEAWVPAGRRVLDIGELFEDSDQVFLGISKEGHYYLKVGETRIDGAFFPLPVIKMEGGISDGYLVHFPGVPSEKIAAWQKEMSQKSSFRGFSMSCSEAACGALKEGFGIRLAGSRGPQVFTEATFDKILRKGFVDEHGEAVPMEIYMTSKRVPSPEDMSGHLLTRDFSYGLGSVLMVAMIADELYVVLNGKHSSK